MWNVIFFTIVTTIGAGFLAQLALKSTRKTDAYGRPYLITNREFLFGSLMISLVFAPLSAFIGWKICESNNLSFNEYWNGWEQRAVVQEITCTRDGPCIREYSCDSYPCNPHPCMCDQDGNNCSTCWDTCWHDCPYVTNEYTYVSRTTLGDFTIGPHRFPLNPDSHRWRRGVRVPDAVIARAGVGEPPFWTEVKNRCQAERPGPVTVRKAYDNYILASEQTILQEYSSDIGEYRERNLLPRLNSSIERFYRSKQVYFTGITPDNPDAWNNALEYLNAQLGVELQGDIHLVVVKDEQVNGLPDRYAIALKAHWLDKAAYGDDTLAKNDIGIVIGTDDGRTVAWSRAFTGMPMGNEMMLTILRDGLKGLPLTPEDIIGPGFSERLRNRPFPTRHPSRIHPTKLESVLWGLDDPSTKFSRLSMTGEDGVSGYLYLKNEIQLSTRQQVTVSVVSFFVCMLVWLFWGVYELPEHHEGNRRNPFSRNKAY